jgi:hypothetical protein
VRSLRAVVNFFVFLLIIIYNTSTCCKGAWPLGFIEVKGNRVRVLFLYFLFCSVVRDCLLVNYVAHTLVSALFGCMCMCVLDRLFASCLCLIPILA